MKKNKEKKQEKNQGLTKQGILHYWNLITNNCLIKNSRCDTMKEKKLFLIIGIILFMFGLAGVFYMSLFEQEKKISDGPCYDERNNVIQGLTCDIQERNEKILYIRFLFLLTAFIGFFILMYATKPKECAQAQLTEHGK